MNKPTWLKDSVAKSDGYYSRRGECLKKQPLSEEFIADWNEEAQEELVEVVVAEDVPLTAADEEFQVAVSDEVAVEVEAALEEVQAPSKKKAKSNKE